ncbi:MAG TPA: TIGR03086 family metal-binding protein [Trebonia sp.]
MSINDEIVELDARAVLASARLVAGATANDLARPTPCPDWTLHGLLTHMTTQHYGFAAAAAGDGDLARWRPRPPGADPVAAYQKAADHVLAAFAADGVLDREFPLPEFKNGPMFPGRQAISFHFVDYVVHSWDVARALGLPVDLDQDVLEAALRVARAVPGGEARTEPGAAFAPAIAWPGGTLLDGIVAVLGRSPGWRPPATV